MSAWTTARTADVGRNAYQLLPFSGPVVAESDRRGELGRGDRQQFRGYDRALAIPYFAALRCHDCHAAAPDALCGSLVPALERQGIEPVLGAAAIDRRTAVTTAAIRPVLADSLAGDS